MPLPNPVALTVAVKVTDCPKLDGLAEETTVVFVAAWLTVWVRAVAVALAVKLASPEYEAVIGCVPGREGPDRDCGLTRSVELSCTQGGRAIVERDGTCVGTPLPGATALTFAVKRDRLTEA